MPEALPHAVVEAAATVLGVRFGSQVHVTGHGVLTDRRSLVVRLRLAGAPVPSAILKLAAAPMPGHFESGGSGPYVLLWNEWAGLEFLSRLERLTERIWHNVVEAATQLDGDTATASVASAAPAVNWIDGVLHDDPDWHAFSPNDCCPDNNLVETDGRVRLFDLEFANFRHALLDLAYVKTTMPSCWCVRRLPDGLGDRLVERYRRRLLAARPELAAGFDTGLAAAQAYWALWALDWQLTMAVKPNGGEQRYLDRHDFFMPSYRQGALLRLNELAIAARTHPVLAPLGGLAELVTGAAHRSWGLVEPLPLYPAYEPATTTTSRKHPRL